MSHTTSMAFITATALVSAAFVAPAAEAQTPSIESGTANWNIKKSFLRYVQMPFVAGTVTTSEGAEKVMKNGKIVDFALPVNAADSALDSDGNGTIDLDGAIHITGHHGGMDIQMSDFKIVVNGTKGVLQADYVRKGAMPSGNATDDTAESAGDDKPIVEFAVPEPLKPGDDNKINTSFTPTAMTEFGIDIFGESYEQGAPIHDSKVDLALSFKDAADTGAGAGAGADSDTDSDDDDTATDTDTAPGAEGTGTEGTKTEETKPGDTKPGDTKPGDTKPAPNTGGSSTGAAFGILAVLLAILGGIAYVATQPSIQAAINQFLSTLPF